MARLIHTSSLWGNLYRSRFFIEGRRVTARRFQQVLDEHGLSHADATRERPSGSVFRYIWEI